MPVTKGKQNDFAQERQAVGGYVPRLEFDKIRWIPRMRIILCLLLPMMPTPAAAQVRSLLTRHVREVTINGQAQLVRGSQQHNR